MLIFFKDINRARQLKQWEFPATSLISSATARGCWTACRPSSPRGRTCSVWTLTHSCTTATARCWRSARGWPATGPRWRPRWWRAPWRRLNACCAWRPRARCWWPSTGPRRSPRCSSRCGGAAAGSSRSRARRRRAATGR